METLATPQALQDQAAKELDGMTWDRWQAMTPAAREAITRRSNSFHHKLRGFEGERVEVTYSEPYAALYSTAEPVLVERFQVGRATGWKPCHLALYSRRAHGGAPVSASAPIASVRRIGK